nr:MAG TPA: hypothetical protein [Caudoviricetes sp.]
MPFPNYSDSGGGDRFVGTVESAIKQKAGTGAPLTSQNLQDIGRTIGDEIAKVVPPTPTTSKPIDTVEIKGQNIGKVLRKGASREMFDWLSQVTDNELTSAYQRDDLESIYMPVLVAKSTDGTGEVIRVATVDSNYANTTGIDSYGWSGPPAGDDFAKWLSGVQATQLNFQKAQFTGDGRTLVATMYDTDTSSGTYYGDQHGLYQIYYHGSLYGYPQYDSSAKCWSGRAFNINSALIVYTDPTTGKQYVTEIKK